jgi:outer membrane protein assembly factor BamB
MRNRRLAPWLPAALAGLLALAAAAASDWPRFRGPNGTGASADKDIPIQWSEKENILWKAALPGHGNSSPIVSGDKVFVQSAAADGSERFLLCLDAANGDVLWKKSAPGAAAHTHDKNSLASSTPAADGERVYAIFWDGKDVSLAAYDFKGERQWERDLGPFKSEHGAGMSPIVYDGKVIVNFDQDKSAAVVAFDAKNGKDAWRADRKGFRTCYSTPFVLERDKGAAEVVVSSSAGVTAYDPANGAEKWAYEWSFAKDPLRTVAGPLAAGGLVIANSGAGSTGERDTIAVRPGTDDAKPSLAWQVRKTFPYVPCLLTKGDYLYGVNDAGFALCISAKTGETVFSERLGSPMTASPVLIDGKVYAAGEDGKVYVFEAEPKFKLLAKNDMGEPVMSSPAAANNRLFVRGKDTLFCVAKPTKSSGN